MTAQPHWSPVDDETGDLLSLVADGPMSGHAEHEWDYYVGALKNCAALDRLIFPNQLREHLRGEVSPRRIGAFTNRALHQGLVAYTGEWEVSDDTEGRNAGKPCRVMRWIGGEL